MPLSALYDPVSPWSELDSEMVMMVVMITMIVVMMMLRMMIIIMSIIACIIKHSNLGTHSLLATTIPVPHVSHGSWSLLQEDVEPTFKTRVVRLALAEHLDGQ